MFEPIKSEKFFFIISCVTISRMKFVIPSFLLIFNLKWSDVFPILHWQRTKSERQICYNLMHVFNCLNSTQESNSVYFLIQRILWVFLHGGFCHFGGSHACKGAISLNADREGKHAFAIRNERNDRSIDLQRTISRVLPRDANGEMELIQPINHWDLVQDRTIEEILRIIHLSLQDYTPLIPTFSRLRGRIERTVAVSYLAGRRKQARSGVSPALPRRNRILLKRVLEGFPGEQP